MKRKVNRVGINTLTVSLPSDWCRKFGIKKGEDIDCVVKDKAIIISPEGQKAVGEIKIKIDTPDLFLNRNIHTPYMLGYDKIIVEYKDRAVASRVRDSLKYIMGFEIVEENDDFCVLKNIAKGIEEEFETIFNSQMKILILVHTELEEAISSKDTKAIPDILERDIQLSRFNAFSKRMLNKVGYADDIKTKGMYSYCILIEMASDSLKAIGEQLLKNPDCMNKNVLDIFKKSKKHLDLLVSIQRATSAQKLADLKKLRNEIFADIDKSISKSSACNVVYLHIYKLVDALHHITQEV
jgi:phosphate uptake regulator